MSTRTDPEAPPTLADLLEQLGGIAPQRVLMKPLPGTATENDLLRLQQRHKGLYELVDGTLVEKVMGYQESILAGWLLYLLHTFLAEHNLGELSAPDGTMRLMAGLARIPDVAFVRREKFPGGQIPREPIPDLVPDLAIEVLSEGNTPNEMQRKLKEYFLAGTKLVWMVDPRSRTVTVHTAPDESQTFGESDTLDGGEVLPGLILPVKRIFERLGAEPTRPSQKSRKKKPRT